MVWGQILAGVMLVAAQIALAFGACAFTFWLYFEAGVKWTPDPVAHQIQGVTAAISTSLASLILAPAGLLARRHTRLGLPIAIGWPLACFALAYLPFGPLLTIGWSGLGVWLLRKPRTQ